MDGVQRAAVLLLSVGEERAAEVLKHLEPKQVQKIGVSLAGMTGVSATEIQNVIDEFLAESEQASSFGVDSEQFLRKTLTTALGPEKASSFIDRILESKDDDGLSMLKWMDARSILDVIRQEHPQVIATILSFLDSELAAEVVSLFPEDKQSDLILRMSTIEAVKPEALSELGLMISERLTGNTNKGHQASLGGLKKVADLINHLDSSIETKVLEDIKKANEELCEQIQEKMFVFENLIDMDGRSVQTLLRDVQSETLMLALKGADERVKEKIFSNMSKRAAELMRDDLDAAGPVKVVDVEAAQKEILATARRLAEEGEISLGGKGGEEMI